MVSADLEIGRQRRLFLHLPAQRRQLVQIVSQHATGRQRIGIRSRHVGKPIAERGVAEIEIRKAEPLDCCDIGHDRTFS
jgi:hypothetical protein